MNTKIYKANIDATVYEYNPEYDFHEKEGYRLPKDNFELIHEVDTYSSFYALLELLKVIQQSNELLAPTWLLCVYSDYEQTIIITSKGISAVFEKYEDKNRDAFRLLFNSKESVSNEKQYEYSKKTLIFQINPLQKDDRYRICYRLWVVIDKEAKFIFEKTPWNNPNNAEKERFNSQSETIFSSNDVANFIENDCAYFLKYSNVRIFAAPVVVGQFEGEGGSVSLLSNPKQSKKLQLIGDSYRSFEAITGDADYPNSSEEYNASKSQIENNLRGLHFNICWHGEPIWQLSRYGEYCIEQIHKKFVELSNEKTQSIKVKRKRKIK